ncbi:MAG: TraG family conjugative transposon ATPase, partial [Bacteroidales bacterium]|nr:TraG family conjugative transposon ATPase [Bacteroidales bacterium]
QVIVEYYDAYFHPFDSFTPEQRADLKRNLITSYKMESSDNQDSLYMDDIDSMIDTPIEKEETDANAKMLMLPSEKRRIKLIRQCQQLKAVIEDSAATLPEKQSAQIKLQEFKEELLDNKVLIKIEKKIDRMEVQKRRLKVGSLSFNTFYEFALERIPQIVKENKVHFDIHDFAALLKQFYRGGDLEMTLNSDLDINLFDEQFIVFEIDKIKDDTVLFPIVVLIIMDVFIQKMRIKKGRKALIIEEAWKAIASPTMAEYIKYLYKTVRKFFGIIGVVTQELQDVIDSPIVKEAIINNSDIKILLDQAKFKDRYDDISRILGLTDVQKQQIFTINALQNKEGRNFFKEVWICRGQVSDVFGVEEPPECYWAYTTERAEKEALKIYIRYYGNIQEAIIHLESDRNKAGVEKYLDFANLINRNNNVMALWEDNT